MHLLPWSHPSPSQPEVTLRGWHSPPSGRPVLHFLHGNGLCGRAYAPMLADLARDFDLWLCDLPGHGDSDAVARFPGWNASAAVARAVFDAQRARFGDVPVHGVGHSLGGVLTALIGGAPPSPFRRMVLLDPVLFPPAMLLGLRMAMALNLARFNPLARSAARRRAVWPDRAAASRALEGRGAYQGWTAEAWQAFVDEALRDGPDGVTLKCAPALEAQVFASGPARLWSHVKALAVPTLVVHGDRTFPFVGRSARRAAALNPRVQALAVVGSHCFMQQRPQEAAAVVRRFLGEEAVGG